MVWIQRGAVGWIGKGGMLRAACCGADMHQHFFLQVCAERRAGVLACKRAML